MLKKTVWLAMAAAVLLSACNTVSGFGEDVQKAGNKLEQSADRHGANQSARSARPLRALLPYQEYTA